MDDYLPHLRQGSNEWSLYLIDILTPLVNQGIRSIFHQAWNMCVEKKETNKYLMTFQNLLSIVNTWSELTVEEETKRMIEVSGCSFLNDLIVCVHIIQLKIMSHTRVGNSQKKIDLQIPKLNQFIHKVYNLVARHMYKNVYLFENGLDNLTRQKYNHEIELIIQNCILSAIRDSIPTQIIEQYLEEQKEVVEFPYFFDKIEKAAIVGADGEQPIIPPVETPPLLSRNIAPQTTPLPIISLGNPPTPSVNSPRGGGSGENVSARGSGASVRFDLPQELFGTNADTNADSNANPYAFNLNEFDSVLNGNGNGNGNYNSDDLLNIQTDILPNNDDYSNLLNIQEL